MDDSPPVPDPGALPHEPFPAWVMGHRGVRAIAPENSMEGFAWAIHNGLGAVEFDVRLTADDVLVCVHDETFEAYGGPPELVSEMTAPQVDEVVLDAGVGVPRLDAVMDVARGRLTLNIEIKNDPRDRSFDPDRRAARVLADVLADRAAAGAADDVVAVSSFDPHMVADFARTIDRHGAPAALLTTPGRDTRGIVDEAAELGVVAVHPHFSTLMSARACSRLLDAGLVVRTWTVNSRVVAQRLRRNGVQAIVTDDPRRIVG